MESNNQFPGIYISDFRAKEQGQGSQGQNSGSCFSLGKKQQEIRDLVHPMVIQEKFKERSNQIAKLAESIEEIKAVPDFASDCELLVAVHEDYDVILKYIGDIRILVENLRRADSKHEIVQACTEESLNELEEKFKKEKEKFLEDFRQGKKAKEEAKETEGNIEKEEKKEEGNETKEGDEGETIFV